jgi:hypothetical protein
MQTLFRSERAIHAVTGPPIAEPVVDPIAAIQAAPVAAPEEPKGRVARMRRELEDLRPSALVLFLAGVGLVVLACAT